MSSVLFDDQNNVNTINNNKKKTDIVVGGLSCRWEIEYVRC